MKILLFLTAILGAVSAYGQDYSNIPIEYRAKNIAYDKVLHQRNEAYYTKGNFEQALQYAQRLSTMSHWEECGNGSSAKLHQNTMIQMECLDKLNRHKEMLPLVLQMSVQNQDFNGTNHNPNGEPDFLPYLRKAIATQKNAKQELSDFEKNVIFEKNDNYTTKFSLWGIPLQMSLYEYTRLNLKSNFADYFKQEFKKTVLYKSIAEEFDYAKPVKYILTYKQNEKQYHFEINDTIATITESKITYGYIPNAITLNAKARGLLAQKLEQHYKTTYDFNATKREPIDRTKAMYVELQTRTHLAMELSDDFIQVIFNEFIKPNF